MTETMRPTDSRPAAPPAPGANGAGGAGGAPTRTPEEGLRTWPDLALGLYERLTGRGAAINYELQDLVVEVPQRVGEDAPRAVWRLNGRLRITSDEADGPGPRAGRGG